MSNPAWSDQSPSDPHPAAPPQVEPSTAAAPPVSRGDRRLAPRLPGDAPVTLALIALNVLVWLGITVTGGEESPWLGGLVLLPKGYCELAGRVATGITGQACAASGATFVPGVADGAFWQVLTSAFAHVDIAHLGFNMLALWFLGPQLERFFGPTRYVALYLLSALAGSVTVFWLTDLWTPTLGASGAVFGLMGALLAVVLILRGNAQSVLMWLGINVAYTFLGPGNISWQGHLGGLVGGLLVAWLLLGAPTPGRRPGPSRWVLIGAFGLVLIVLLAARTLLLAA